MNDPLTGRKRNVSRRQSSDSRKTAVHSPTYVDHASFSARLSEEYNAFNLKKILLFLTTAYFRNKVTPQPEDVGLDVPLSVYDAAANTSYCYTTDANKNVNVNLLLLERGPQLDRRQLSALHFSNRIS